MFLEIIDMEKDLIQRVDHLEKQLYSLNNSQILQQQQINSLKQQLDFLETKLEKIIR